jgi:alkaline phosphatase
MKIPDEAQRFRFLTRVRVVALLCMIVLAGCGCGGGGDDGTTLVGGTTSPSQSTSTPTTVPTVPTTPTGTPPPPTVFPKNVILVVGDGMGFEQVRAASFFAAGQAGSLSFESFPNQAQMNHNSADGSTTDSAASATAIATGFKVNNGVISIRIPGDGSELTTLLEIYKAQGKRTGLVTNSFIEDATPAALAAHESSRNLRASIASDMLQRSQPHLLMGGYSSGALEPTAATTAGYTVVQDRASMNVFNSTTQPLAGLFAVGHMPYEFDGDYSTVPDLSEMTVKALNIMDADPQGFFLLIENENIDESGHDNNIQRNVAATVELSDAVQEVLDWANGRQDTLIIVTADHETGGLAVITNQGQGNFPTVTWSTGGHTKTPVPVFASGPLSDRFTATMDNTDFYQILTGVAPGTLP